MGVAQLQTEALSQLRSQDQLNLLDSIDQLRSEGIGRYVSLPQIIVCGDQSAGKSSVLEAISGVSFPVQSKTCTRFPTELILRRTPEVSSSVSIVPDASRTEAEKLLLMGMSRGLEGHDGLGEMIEAAKDAMGIRDHGKTFSRDLLRIEITGPDRSHLTIVDLPGLIHSSTNPQADDDVGLVTGVVRKYMEQSRSVILAVISAKNDLENQIVMKMRREADPAGQRTMGIITKPDTLHIGSKTEEFFASLAQNEKVELRLGWHVLKNLDSEDAFFNMAKRDIQEQKFFSNSIWSSLSPHLLGISNLRPRLSNVLTKQIVSELPSLVKEITSKLEECRKTFVLLGPRRETRDEQQKYLLGVSVKFQSLVKAAIDGIYNDTFFDDAQSDKGYCQRLRAVIQNSNQQFAKGLSDHGHYRYIVESQDEDHEEEPDADRVAVTREDFVTHIQTMMFRTRGRELPGTFSPMIVEDLFREQCRPWKKNLNAHIETVTEATRKFLGLVCEHVADGTTRQYIMLEIVGPALETITKALQLKADELLKPHKYWHPITYNHYFTENLQKARDERDMVQVRKTLASGLGVPEDQMQTTNYKMTGTVNLPALTRAIALLRNEPDMDRFAASEALDRMEAYYKVALKRFIDDAAVDLVEAKLLKALPDIFSPMAVCTMSPDLVDRIASETGENLRRREQLEKQHDVLSKGSEVCKQFASMKLIDTIIVGVQSPSSVDKPISENDAISTDEPLSEGAPASEVKSLPSNDQPDSAERVASPDGQTPLINKSRFNFID